MAKKVHKNAGVRKQSTPLTETVYLSSPEQELESILLPPQLRTVKGQPELMLISWERLTVVADSDPINTQKHRVGCMSAHDAIDGVGRLTLRIEH